jgi:hypothetical protein
VDRSRDRVEYLLETLRKQDERIIIPAPAFSEFLVLAGEDGPLYLAKIREMSIFRVVPFDNRAAIELADIEIAIRAKLGKRGSVPEADWQKVKFDRQIVAIAKSHGARCIYSDDPHIEKHGKDCGIEVIPLSKLPLPPAVQTTLDLKEVASIHDQDKVTSAPSDISGSGDGHPEGQAGTQEQHPEVVKAPPDQEGKESEAEPAVNDTKQLGASTGEAALGQRNNSEATPDDEKGVVMAQDQTASLPEVAAEKTEGELPIADPQK